MANQEFYDFKPSALSQMRHELRTPLSGLVGVLNLLHQTPLNETQKQYLDWMQVSVERLLSFGTHLEHQLGGQ